MSKNDRKRLRPAFQDLSGQTFGSWTVLSYAGNKNHSTLFLCQCVCGTTKEVYSFTLRKGLSVSCGKGECSHMWKHGGSRGGAPEYIIWSAIKDRCLRCNDPKTRKNYQDRGITICLRWRESFAAFLEDVGPRTDELLSIDRIDNDGGYTCGRCEECTANGWPFNCRWATKTEQAHNTRSNHWITFADRTQSITDWAKEIGIDIATILYRLGAGWTVEEALTTQTKYTRRKAAGTSI